MTRSTQIAILSVDSRLLGQALRVRLDREDDLSVVGVAGTVHELLVRAQGRSVDVLLVHLGVRSASAARAIVRDLKVLLPSARVIVLGCSEDDANSVVWIEAGAAAWLDDDASYETLLGTIHDARQGRVVCPSEALPEIARRIVCLKRYRDDSQSPPETLTDREVEVASWLRLGASNKKLSRRMGVSLGTTKSYVSQVLKKLGAKSRGDLDLRRTGKRAK